MRYEPTKAPPLPSHLKVRLPMARASDATESGRVKQVLDRAGLHTVCQEASCPNLGHCWSRGTATFMIMGKHCTRRCGFCDVSTARPLALDPGEPDRLAASVVEMGLRHVVITSVDRDDLKDCGSEHFAACMTAVRAAAPNTTIEVLIPDFKGRPENLKCIWDARPDILNHNIETVRDLFRTICPQSNYAVSLETLRMSAGQGFLTKSGIILGLGETIEQVRGAIQDLRQNRVQMLTIGQYMQPTPDHAPLLEYVPVSVFDDLKKFAMDLGFSHVESGPLVRSSYHAGDSLAELQPAG